MFKNSDISSLAALFSFGVALAFLSAVSALWPYTESEDGLASFAFTLVVVFAMVVGNISIVGAKTLRGDRTETAVFGKLSDALAVTICASGFFTAAILFSDGLSSWFSVPPIMPDALILFVRILAFIPVGWLFVALMFRIFSLKVSKNKEEI